MIVDLHQVAERVSARADAVCKRISDGEAVARHVYIGRIAMRFDCEERARHSVLESTVPGLDGMRQRMSHRCLLVTSDFAGVARLTRMANCSMSVGEHRKRSDPEQALAPSTHHAGILAELEDNGP